MVTSLLLQYAPASHIVLVCAGKAGIKVEEQILVSAQLTQKLVSTNNGGSVACIFATKIWIRTAILFYMVHPRIIIR